jgi:ABC-type lipoprotein release transport system permease subunit
MAKSAHLKKDDVLTLRWRDIHGAFNAADIHIVEVMDTPVLEMDNGQVWIDLTRLQKMKDAENKATYIILKDSQTTNLTSNEWEFQSIDDLLIDLHNIMKVERIQAFLMYSILLFLAMIAIFDTQVLAVFKRRKEIGTLTALGMTQREIIRMFTVEGMMYAVLASVAAGVIGFPLFLYYGTKGWNLPSSYDSFGIAGFKDAIIFYYSPQMILLTISIVIFVTAFVSWIPTLRIARLKPTDALRGRLS